MRNFYYTFWLAKNNDVDNAELLHRHEPVYTKRTAFKKASNIALIYPNDTILVRKIFNDDSGYCLQWKIKRV